MPSWSGSVTLLIWMCDFFAFSQKTQVNFQQILGGPT